MCVKLNHFGQRNECLLCYISVNAGYWDQNNVF